MKKFLVLAFSLLMLSLTAAAPRPTTSTADSYTGSVLCLPAGNSSTQSNCLAAGPTIYRQRMAALGVTFPIQSLPAHAPSIELTRVPMWYALVHNKNKQVPVYASLADADAGKPVKRYLPKGAVYVSYDQSAWEQGKKFYRIDWNEWVWAGDVEQIAPASFQGLEFHRTPDTAFGWILGTIETQRAPGFASPDYTRHYFYRYQTVPVYTVQTVDNVEWAMIAPDEWMQAKFLGIVTPNTTPPDGVDNGRWISVNLYEQTLAVYQDSQLVFATLISSGLPGWWTRPGLFPITQIKKTEHMTGAFEADRSDYYDLEDVPFTLYFDEARALHGTYWHNNFGYPMSHGCVNMSSADARWIFNWAQEGDWVYVWDPSGVTPEDPSLYSAGGA